jgi:hypothetical protein
LALSRHHCQHLPIVLSATPGFNRVSRVPNEIFSAVLTALTRLEAVKTARIAVAPHDTRLKPGVAEKKTCGCIIA